MFFNSCQIVPLLQNQISVSTYDFQHIKKNCKIQSSLSRVENYAGEIKNYCDGNVYILNDLDNPVSRIYASFETG